MSKFVIESNVPVPVKKRKSRYEEIPLSNMKVGQSVRIDVFSPKNINKRFKAIYSGIYKLGMRKNIPMSKYRLGIREKVDKAGNSEVRIWRIS
jgi:hypothetical protein